MRGVMIVNGYHRHLSPRHTDDLISTICRHANLKVYATEFPGHGRHLAARAADSGADVVVAVGGDGTLNEVINGVAGSTTAVAVIPNGTANDFARYMHINEDDMQVLSACRTRYIDLIRVNNWHFITVGGLGLACDTLARAERFKRGNSAEARWCRKVGPLAYLFALSSLVGSFSRPRGEVFIETERARIACDPLSLLVANQPVVGGLFSVAPSAANNDGKCDLFIIDRTPHWTPMAWAVAQTCWPHEWEPGNVIRLKSKQMTIMCEQPMSFFGDGEVRLEGQCFYVEVLPRALRVLVPPTLSAARAYPARNMSNHLQRLIHQPLRPATIRRTRT